MRRPSLDRIDPLVVSAKLLWERVGARRLRLLGGPVVLALLVWRIGAGPFADGVRAVDASVLATAVLIGLVTTWCCTWRWRLVARGLDVDVAMRPGVAAYYRSQFLNSVLPGGVLGDVHRALRHGRDEGDRAAAARTVAWERSAGQATQAALTVVVLIVLPSPVRSAMPSVVAVVVPLLAVGVLAYRFAPMGGTSWLARAGRTVRADIRGGLLGSRTWPPVVLASGVVVAGHVASFVVAAHAAGADAPLARLVPLALVVLLAMAVPLNVAGWGPREGVAAWVFATAGLGAGLGVATAVVYGVMVMVATLPGAVVLMAASIRRPADCGVVGGPAVAAPSELATAEGSCHV
jgi:glycosyltransferase 2 family protein